ncbi:conserved hypothetical protein [uncultured Thiomicrorhabdus sp.]
MYEYHSLSPYLLRSFNPASPAKKIEDKYAILDKVGQHDTYEIFKVFMEANSNDFQILEDKKLVYRFNNMSFDANNRLMYGWFQVGNYGVKTEIIDINTGKVDFNKAQDNAEIINHFIYIKLPQGYNEGMALLHSFRGTGIKTLLHDLLKEPFKNKTTLVLQMNPLAYDKALTEWQDGNAKEIRLTKFVGLTDIADTIKSLGHDEQEYIIKAPRNGFMGKFKNYLDKNSNEYKAVEVLTPLCRTIKTVVELNGKKRVFTIGKNASNSVCEINASEDLQLVEGVPTLDSIKDWCEEVANEYSSVMYPGQGN